MYGDAAANGIIVHSNKFAGEAYNLLFKIQNRAQTKSVPCSYV